MQAYPPITPHALEGGEIPSPLLSNPKCNTMVTITDYKTVLNKDGETFYALVVESGLEPVRSQKTGKLYFTTRKCSVPTTFDQNACKKMLGTQLEGNIRKIPCDPYEYVVKETGEILELNYHWEYFMPDEEVRPAPHLSLAS